LVADDEPSIRFLIEHVLKMAGHEVIEAGNGDEALARFCSDRPDLVILDLVMPGRSGLDVLAEIRAQGTTPVILLTGLASERDRVNGLDHGADDYLVKPFSLAELEARVRALLRRVTPAPSDPLEIDHAAREVRLHGEVVALTRLEFDLLAFLAARPRTVLGIPELLEQVWNSSVDWQDPSTVKEHIRRLRLKIEPDPANPVLLRTVRGAGFLYEPGALASTRPAQVEPATA
jgi:DNA-binding response OmpR family regulator